LLHVKSPEIRKKRRNFNLTTITTTTIKRPTIALQTNKHGGNYYTLLFAQQNELFELYATAMHQIEQQQQQQQESLLSVIEEKLKKIENVLGKCKEKV